MDRTTELRDLLPGRLLTDHELRRILGDVPPQSEFTVDIRRDTGFDRKAFRRHRVAGREAWEVTR